MPADNFLRAYGLPHLLKFVHSPQLLLVLNEMNAGYRQVFTDGRPLPKDPNPSWQGYSSAKWSGDTLVIDTIGLRDDTWIDWNGSVLTEAAKVRRKFVVRISATWKSKSQSMTRRPTRSPGPSLKQRIVVDTDLIDEICLENEKFEEFVDRTRPKGWAEGPRAGQGISLKATVAKASAFSSGSEAWDTDEIRTKLRPALPRGNRVVRRWAHREAFGSAWMIKNQRPDA